MLEMTFTPPIGAPVTLNYPTDPTSLTWAQWLEFKQILHEPKTEAEDTDGGATYLLRLCRALDVFNPQHKISQFPVHTDPLASIQALTPTVDMIYNTLDNAGVDLPDPDKYRVEYKGEWYTISGRDLERATDKTKWVGSVGEMLTWNQLDHLMRETIAEPPIGEDGKAIDQASIEFTFNRGQMAAVLRKVGEDLPTTEAELEAFIWARAEHFAELPMSVVRDVAAFFLVTTIKLKQNLNTNTSSKAPTRIQYNPKTKKMQPLKVVR